MTDGVQRVYGMEYRPIKDLKVLAPAGFKVLFFFLMIYGLLNWSIFLSMSFVINSDDNMDGLRYLFSNLHW